MLALIATLSLAAAPAGADTILIHGTRVGSQTASTRGRTTQAEYAYTDRGHGPHIKAAWTLNAAGLPTAYFARGNDEMKAPVTEVFRIADGRAAWQNSSEHGEGAYDAGSFYWPRHAPPEFTAVLARALLAAPGHTLALLPAGQAHIAAGATMEVRDAGGRTVALRQYQITGLDFSPIPLWLDANGHTAALLTSWLEVVGNPYAGSLEQLAAAQQAAERTWCASLAQRATRIPAGDVVIRGARLFDPRDLRVTEGMSVLVRGERIVRIAKDADLPAPGAEVIAAAGRFLMPGLWDNHQHLGENDGALDLVNGVTSARDMANDTGEFLERVARFDAGTELGPRVFKAGVIDGAGPFAGPTKMLVDNAADAVKDVDWYAQHGYGQIKVYSSVKPELVPVIADEAHAQGLRVSGHVPAFMTARQFVAAGADEIQHINFIVLNFMSDAVKDTRGIARFTAVAAHARDFTPDRPEVAAFIAYLESHHTVLDPTLNVFESLFSGDPTAVTPGLEEIAPRFPPQARERARNDALPPPIGEEGAYRQAFPALLELLKALYAAGVTIIPGTDSLAGYSLPHELELYVRAGIPPPEVLRLATLTSARVVGLDRDRGVIAPGKLADLILVEGDPSVHISSLRHVALVMRGGRLYDPAVIEAGMGISPQR